MKLSIKNTFTLLGLITLLIVIPIQVRRTFSDTAPPQETIRVAGKLVPVVRHPLGSATPPSPTVAENQQHPIMLVRTFVDKVEFDKKEVVSLSEGFKVTNVWSRIEPRTNYVLGYYDRQKLVEIGIVDSLSLKR